MDLSEDDMKNFVKLFTLLGIGLICLCATRPVQAFPPIPSSFFGTVKVDGGNVPDGILIKALINGQAYAVAKTQTYQGDSVYSLDVLGDDSSTTIIEGGHDGDTIVFTIGEEVAEQTGKWKGGTNINLNLSASTMQTKNTTTPTIVQTATTILEQATTTSTLEGQPTATISITQVVPLEAAKTQTATRVPEKIINPTIVEGQSTATTRVLTQVLPLAGTITQTVTKSAEQTMTPTTEEGQPSATTSVLGQVSPIKTALIHSTPATFSKTNSENDPASPSRNFMVIGIVGAVIFFFPIWLVFGHKPKTRNNPSWKGVQK
jgi:hypothetical protein